MDTITDVMLAGSPNSDYTFSRRGNLAEGGFAEEVRAPEATAVKATGADGR
jgi:hypothetical protein